ncbi:MAG TPA: carboxypeptidase regulatory-like domain-containing protein, partial [Salinimicrobium sp.]|nr:carboxypeptidase regulatory-like domain-containing protein [Salinimicrobium sp.]
MKILLPLVLLFLLITSFSVKTITGTVTDESGMAIPGVNITVKGSKTAAQTNSEGQFKIEA